MEKSNLKIRRLSDDTIRHIAAGEVIERPASVLKELIENSLDAAAKKVQVDIRSAGKKVLRVADDGAGIAAGDCRLAFERHTTSKISEIDDLDKLSTFGFRGEALFSVAAVSRVTLASCAKNSKKGWMVKVDGGKVTEEHEASPVPGTVIEVQDLFFNTPARAKFLKSDASEKGHLTRVIEEAALANPEVAFSLKSDGRSAFQWSAHDSKNPPADYRKRITEVLGEELTEGMLSSHETHREMKAWTFLARPDRLSPSRSFQFFFINRRPVASRVLQQALYRAYEPFRSRDRHPIAVTFIEVPADQFDVNVHPAKREVRFRNESPIFQTLTGIFSGALLRAKGIPSITGKYTDVARAPVVTGGGNYHDWVRDNQSPYSAAARAASLPASLGEELMLSLESPAPALGLSPESGSPRWYTPPFRYLGQIEQSYLVFDASGGILIVDQHAAQEKIFFEKYIADIETGKVRSEALMLPLPIELPASRIHQIASRAKKLEAIGFEIAPYGKTTLHVTAAPSVFAKASDLRDVMHRLIESLESEGEAAADVKHHAVATVACKAAVKAHDRLGAAEAIQLLEDLKKCKDGTCCPHGRPSMIALNRDELARRFKRPGATPQ